MLIFTGVYVDLQISNGSVDENKGFITGESTYIGTWGIFVYFSFAIMTLGGGGVEIKPRTSYAAMAICVEMLVGLMFHVYVFGVGLLLLANKKFNTNNKKRRESAASPAAEGNNKMVDGSDLIMLTLLQN